MIRRFLICAALVAATLGPATSAFAQTAPPSGSIGIGLLEAPVSREGDPRARTYIVDHLAQHLEGIQHRRRAVPYAVGDRYAGLAGLADVEGRAQTLPTAQLQPPTQRAQHSAPIVAGNPGGDEGLLERSDATQVAIEPLENRCGDAQLRLPVPAYALLKLLRGQPPVLQEQLDRVRQTGGGGYVSDAPLLVADGAGIPTLDEGERAGLLSEREGLQQVRKGEAPQPALQVEIVFFVGVHCAYCAY